MIRSAQTSVFQALLSNLRQQYGAGGQAAITDPRLAGDVRSFLALIGGGALSHEASCLRAWAQGEFVSPDLLAQAMDRLLAPSPERLTDILNEANPGIRLFYSPPHAGLDVIHQSQPLSVQGITIDPILDFEPCRSVLEFLESATDQGARLRIDGLKLYAITEPQEGILTLSGLYAKIFDGQHKSLIFEDALYIVRKDTIPHGIAKHMDDAVRSGFFIEALPVSVTPGAREQVSSAKTKNFPPKKVIFGEVPTQEIKKQSQKRWVEGIGMPDTNAFNDMPTLKAKLDQLSPLLHETDIHRILSSIHSTWSHCMGAEFYETEMAVLRIRLMGVLGEIECRQTVLHHYQEALAADPSTILLVEGQIKTTDGAISDAVIGRFADGSFDFIINDAYEVSVSTAYALACQKQNEDTLGRRLPQLGMTIQLSSQKSCHVHTRTDKARGHVLIAERAIQESLSRLMDQVMTEIMAYLALKKGAVHSISLSKKRLLHHNRRGKWAGRFFNSVIEELWEELDKKSKVQGSHDLFWFLAQLESLHPFAPADMQERLLVYIVALRNASPLLGQDGRKPIPEMISGIIPKPSATYGAIAHWYNDILEHLKKREIPFFEDPLAESKEIRSGGRDRNEAREQCWNGSTPKDVYSALLEMASKDDVPLSRKYVEGYALILKNISEDLNDHPEKKRSSEKELADSAGLSASLVSRNIKDIEAHLALRGWPLIPDPDQKRKDLLKKGHATSKKLEGLWDHDSREKVVEELERRILAEKDAALQHELKGFLVVFKDMSSGQSLSDETTPRLSRADLAARCNLTPSKIGKFQADIEPILKEKKWTYGEAPFQHNVDKSFAAKNAMVDLRKAWELPSPEAFVDSLQKALATHEGKQSQHFLLANLLCFKNMMSHRGINPKGRRRPLSLIIQASGVRYQLVKQYEHEVTAAIEARKWPLLRQPEVVRGQALDARFELASIFLLAGEEKWTAQMVRDELALSLMDHVNPSDRQALERFILILDEYAADLNPTGRARDPLELSKSYGIHRVTMRAYVLQLTQLMRGAGIAVLP